jgi:hypothetical protein
MHGMARDDVTEFCEAIWRQERRTADLLARRVDPNSKDRWGAYTAANGRNTVIWRWSLSSSDVAES